jgi:site-specific recombinase XerD
MPDPWQALRRDFAVSLKAENKSQNTQRIYLGAVDSELTSYLAAMTDRWQPSTCSVVFRALKQFFGWLIREGEIDRSPMERMRPPAIPEQPVSVLTDDQLRTLLNSCEGRTFVQRRDAALIRLFIDTGCRRGEIAGLTVDDVDHQHRRLAAKLLRVLADPPQPGPPPWLLPSLEASVPRGSLQVDGR